MASTSVFNRGHLPIPVTADAHTKKGLIMHIAKRNETMCREPAAALGEAHAGPRPSTIGKRNWVKIDNRKAHYNGRTMPELAFWVPDYLLRLVWHGGYQGEAWRPDGVYVVDRIRHLRIPGNSGGDLVAEQWFDGATSEFVTLEVRTRAATPLDEYQMLQRHPMAPAGRRRKHLKCVTKHVIDLGLPKEYRLEDFGACSMLLRAVRRILFGGESNRPMGLALEAFFDDEGNFDFASDLPLNQATVAAPHMWPEVAVGL